MCCVTFMTFLNRVRKNPPSRIYKLVALPKTFNAYYKSTTLKLKARSSYFGTSLENILSRRQIGPPGRFWDYSTQRAPIANSPHGAIHTRITRIVGVQNVLVLTASKALLYGIPEEQSIRIHKLIALKTNKIIKRK